MFGGPNYISAPGDNFMENRMWRLGEILSLLGCARRKTGLSSGREYFPGD